uniref:DUF1995 domain-containing protein n=1 Tax=Pyramimonas obovata TaxID=1411642 RepID=A0A7S0MRW1_9CHLO|mmetsp:Transcript_11994/g.25209  ORF Transcript_11994/g.25209 Transcript_11994/m.25209 type:complete len:324 (+) Transcript_11994:48-1019(+)|eukprot:CAMPEP_0118924174 /NCGR_PEP_ID=MMETSP1169-20130426/2430_1 /TAXON_ID=36882 /ORGANISM="Pyramimonas obovata, Strain CCMP722" /LENGTH=323 /DNA_ID=CAMNT_0006865263 /DNA_START=46 /DNA_END=1020 /DNA_ORIENTATION=+
MNCSITASSGHIPRVERMFSSRSSCIRLKQPNTKVLGVARRQMRVAAMAQESKDSLVKFPYNYYQVTSQSQDAVRKALADGHKLIEVEFPSLGLDSVPGDSEGCNEMNESAALLRQFCKMFENAGNADKVRVYFPDAKELQVATTPASGINMSGGKWETSPTFVDSAFQLDFLTKPTALLELGIDLSAKVQDRIRPEDEIFIAAYPSFNVNEMITVEELHRTAANGRPIITYNGELDRIRSGYYPKFFYPKIGKLAETFIPKFEQAYYIHNFKGSRGGILFRAYPGPWQVLKRTNEDGDTVCIHTQDTMPTLKEVALEILPRA